MIKLIKWNRIFKIALSLAAGFAISGSIFFYVMQTHQNINKEAVDGILDIRNWNFKKDGIVSLKGDWNFIWKEFTPVDQIVNRSDKKIIKVPSAWNWKQKDGSVYPVDGYATYSLDLLCDPTRYDVLAAKLPHMATAYELYINRRLTAENGKIGKTEEEHVPQFKPQIITFKAESRLSFVLHVSNFSHITGGQRGEIEVGTSDQIIKRHNVRIITYSATLGISIVFGLFFIFNFVLYRKESKESLYFGLFYLAIAVRVLVAADGLLPHLFFLNADWTNLYRGVYISHFIAIILLSAFFYELYKSEAYRIPQLLIVLAFGGFSLFFMITDAKIFLLTTKYSDMAASLVYLYLLFVMIKKAYKSEDVSVIFIIAFYSVFISTMILDSMLRQIINHKIYLAQIGLYLFVFIQTSILVIRFSSAFTKIELQSKELVRLNKTKDEILANTSHELRTPLNGIIGIAQNLLKELGPLNEKAKSNLSLIVQSGKRLFYLINDIIDIERIRHQQLEINKQTIDVKPVIENLKEFLQVELRRKRLKMELELDHKSPVFADINRLNQILHSLINNAIKHTDNGKIIISTNEADNEVVFSITDTGRGINTGDLERIFDRFEKAGSTVPGVGIGLNITRHLVEAQGGRIWVDSELHKGSSFHFTLPVSDREPEIIDDEVVTTTFDFSHLPILKNKTDSTSKRNTVLVVDDDHANHIAINGYLEEHFHLRTSYSGEEALERLEEEKPDLVLLDIMMPGIDGIEVCRRIRKKYSKVQLPIVFQTCKNESKDLDIGFKVGGNDYIAKPFNKPELLARVTNILETTAKLKEIPAPIQELLILKEKVVYIQSKKGEILCFTSNNRNYFRRLRITMKEVCEYLPLQFSQVNRFYSINLHYISSIGFTTRNKRKVGLVHLTVNLEDQIEFVISSKHTDELQEKLKN